MKCILHIGTEKTGTTILQQWLYDNQKELSNAGVYLSDNLGKTNNQRIPAYFQGGLDDWAWAKGIRSEAEKEKYFEGFIEGLTNEVITANKAHDYFVITSEHLHSRVRKKEEIERLHKFLVSVFDEVEVVCYFRDQFDVAVSLYSTALKVGSFENIESFVEQANPDNYYYNYIRIADNWAEVFGENNCNFRIYDISKFFDNDIRLDFLSVIGKNIDSAKLNMARRSSNESLFLLQAAAFKAINRNIPYWRPDKLGINRHNEVAKKMILNVESFKLGKITSTKGELIRNRFSETNALFFEKYFTAEDEFPIYPSDSKYSITCDEAMDAVEDALEFGLKINASITPSLKEKITNALRDLLLRIVRQLKN